MSITLDADRTRRHKRDPLGCRLRGIPAFLSVGNQMEPCEVFVAEAVQGREWKLHGRKHWKPTRLPRQGCDLEPPHRSVHAVGSEICPASLCPHTGAWKSGPGLATGVLVLPNHHPVVLAKRLATLDALSGGRLRVCVGMGWMKEEIEACGTDFASRGRRADEQLQVMRALWAGTDPAGVDHHGEFFSFTGAASWPKPVQPGGVPLHVGGHSRAAARRAGRYGDGLQPLGVAGDQLASLVSLMREAAERADRDPDRLALSLGHLVSKIDPDRAGRLIEQGASRIVLAMSPTADLEQAKDELSACAERLGLQ